MADEKSDRIYGPDGDAGEESGGEAQEGAVKGNKISGIGKIFLVAAVIILQGVAAFSVVKGNYTEIREVVASFKPSGGYYFQLEDIIVNPAGSNGERYLVFSIAIELDNSDDLSRIEGMRAEVLDRLNFRLSQKTVRELSNQDQRMPLKEELKEELELILTGSMVRNLYFTKYVIQ